MDKTTQAEIPDADELNLLKSQVERLQVQLAGCFTAAMGATQDPAQSGDYGWSAAYAEVLKLRHAADAMLHIAEEEYRARVKAEEKVAELENALIAEQEHVVRMCNGWCKGVSGLLGDYSGEPVPAIDSIQSMLALEKMIAGMAARIAELEGRNDQDKGS